MRIDERIATGTEPAFSFEFFPPKTPEGEANLAGALGELARLEPTFVSVTYGAGGTPAQREKTIEQLRDGRLDVLVATDVAARGLDVERISHVVNYDLPIDTESYVHRIGRTGRAGRTGDAISFVTPRERRMLGSIERTTGGTVEEIPMPSAGESSVPSSSVIFWLALKVLKQYQGRPRLQARQVPQTARQFKMT